jgi:transcriptional regulator with XRE-family HTH domain
MQTGPAQNRLLEVRNRRGITLTQIAEACGVYASTVRRWQEASIPDEQLPTVGALLDVSVPYLTGWSDREGPYEAPSAVAS